MLPVYDPKSFASIDLRKYHIRDVKDVIKFHEFVASRMEEAQFILKKFNTQLATFKAVSNQLRAKQEVQQQSYGAPTQPSRPVDVPEIQTVDRSLEKQHEELLDDIRKAQAEENLAETLEENSASFDAQSNPTFDDPVEAVLGKYKLVYGKKGPMYYRENEEGKIKLVKKSDVPEDIKQQLLSLVDKEE